jgi:hypothetical protein
MNIELTKTEIEMFKTEHQKWAKQKRKQSSKWVQKEYGAYVDHLFNYLVTDPATWEIGVQQLVEELNDMKSRIERPNDVTGIIAWDRLVTYRSLNRDDMVCGVQNYEE